MTVKIGVLALQGDFREHIAMVRSLGAEAIEVRLPADLDGLDGLIIPGGESTTIGKLARSHGLLDPIRECILGGLPAFGTCAGMILLASSTTGADQPQLEVLDVVVERNAFGRQVESFEEDLVVEGFDDPVRAVFIRAPWIEKASDDVEILARSGDHPVVVRQGNMLATAFHPELTDDARLHRLFLDIADNPGE